MRQSCDVVLATTNRHKYAESREILGAMGVRLGLSRIGLEEVQSGSLARISAGKARAAFARLRRPVIAEDSGLFVDSLGGFPGPYSSYVLGTIGCEGVLRLVGARRSARFESVVTYCDGGVLKSFRGRADGSILRRARGSGWGYDPIFSSPGFARSKNSSSHRFEALGRFARWYLRARRAR